MSDWHHWYDQRSPYYQDHSRQIEHPPFDPSKLSPWWHKKVGKFEIAFGLSILALVWIPFLKNIFS